MFIVIANVFLLIFFVPAEQKSVADNQEVDFKHINAIILPHHLLVEKLMDEFYANVAKENQYERIILISPNHFGYGYGLIQTTDQLDDISVDQALATSLGEDKAAFVEGGYFDLEHGLHSHYDFIKNHFGDTPIVPILLKNEGTQERLDQLVGSLAKNDLQNTLIIASIDFSHGTPEAVALANDQRIFDWLENWNAGQSNDTSGLRIGIVLNEKTHLLMKYKRSLKAHKTQKKL